MDALAYLLVERSREAEDAYSKRASADLAALHDRLGHWNYSRFEPSRISSAHDYDRAARLRYLECLEEGALRSLNLDRLPEFLLSERDVGELRLAVSDIARDAEHFAGVLATSVTNLGKATS